MIMTPYEYQTDAVNSIYEYWRKNNNNGNPVVCMPVGSGKSFTMALFIKSIFVKFGDKISKVMCLTHVKELIEQDREALLNYWPGAPVGVYSASVGGRDTYHKIIFGGIQSVVGHYKEFGKVNVIIIDECHLVSPKDTTSYRKLVDNLKLVNPKLKVVGFTGTPYRLDCGWITENGLFNDICYDMCNIDGYEKLINDKRLCNVIPKRTELQVDTSEVSIRGGEFVEKDLQLAVDKDEITKSAINETIKCCHDRKHILIFATGVKHATHICEYLQSLGETCTVIDGALPKDEREKRINGFKNGTYRFCTNVNVLSTGFNFPAIDCLVMLRPTQSVSLYIQAVGRGIRYSPQKENCLVLDFSGNVQRLGCINDPIPPKKKGAKRSSENMKSPVKVCPQCNTYVGASAKVCPACGWEFKMETGIYEHASLQEILKKRQQQHQNTYDVTKMMFAKVKTRTGEQVLVTYYSGIQTIAKDWLNISSPRPEIREKSIQWIYTRIPNGEDISIPSDNQSLLKLLYADKLLKPKKITVDNSTGYQRIIKYVF